MRRTQIQVDEAIYAAARRRAFDTHRSLAAVMREALGRGLGLEHHDAAVAAEFDTDVTRRGPRSRVSLPLFGARSGARAQVSNADIERALADADAAALPSPGASPRRRRNRSR